MKKIVKKLNELLEICDVRVKKVDNDAKNNAARSAVLDKREKDVEAANKLAVEGIERFNALSVKHEDLECSKKLRKELENEIERYKGLQGEIKGEFKEVEKAKEEGVAEVERQKEKLKRSIELLEKKKGEYKAEVIKSVSAELKKKGIEL